MEYPVYLRMTTKLFNTYRQKPNDDYIDMLWGEIGHHEPTVVAKAFKNIISEEKFLPAISVVKEYCTTQARNAVTKTLAYDKKPYVLTDLEMLWFNLNAKYCGYTIKNRVKWDAGERNRMVVEWSKGLIHEGNLPEIRAGYEKYCVSYQESEQTFNINDLLDAIG